MKVILLGKTLGIYTGKLKLQGPQIAPTQPTKVINFTRITEIMRGSDGICTARKMAPFRPMLTSDYYGRKNDIDRSRKAKMRYLDSRQHAFLTWKEWFYRDCLHLLHLQYIRSHAEMTGDPKRLAHFVPFL